MLDGMSLTQLSKESGISLSMLSRMFSDVVGQKRTPSLRTLKRLGNYLSRKSGTNVTLDQLSDALEL